MRIFVDRDVGPRLGRALREVGVDVALHKDWYNDAALVADTTWVRDATSNGRVILTRDLHIRTRPGERAVFEAAGAKGIVLATSQATQLENLRALLIAWPQIAAEMDAGPGPLMLGVNKAGRLTQYLPIPIPSARLRPPGS